MNFIIYVITDLHAAFLPLSPDSILQEVQPVQYELLPISQHLGRLTAGTLLHPTVLPEAGAHASPPGLKSFL